MDADEPARARLAEAWPLFGLRLHTERLALRLPTDRDLLELMDLARAGIHPPGEMPFGVAWSILPSPAFERGYLAYHWANRSGWSPGDWELGLAVSIDGVLIGMQGMHARQFASLRTVHTGSWVGRSYQGHCPPCSSRPSATVPRSKRRVGSRSAGSTLPVPRGGLGTSPGCPSTRGRRTCKAIRLPSFSRGPSGAATI